MGRALFVASGIASALLLFSCEKTQAPQIPPAAIADAKSGFCLMQDLPFLEITGSSVAQRSSVQVGEKLALLGQSRHLTQGGKERDYVHVRRDTGAEGWVRADYVVSNAILAVVTTDDAVIYSVPRNTAATTATIPRMTVLAIHSDSGGMPFIRVSAYDQQQKALLKEVYLRNEGVSARPDDVQAAILLQLAADSGSPKQQQAFLSSAIKDYPGSLFMPQLQDALQALLSPPPAPPPASPPAAEQPGASQAGPQQPAASPSPAAPAAPGAAAPAQVQPAGQSGQSGTQ